MIANIAKVSLILVAVMFTASTASAQTQTDTNCTTSPDYGAGRTTNCTSTTTPPPPSGGVLEGINKALAANRAKAEAKRDQNTQQAHQAQLSQEAIKELLAEEKKEREAKDTVDFIYCRQNPKGNITDSEGKLKTCADAIEYTKAFCSVNPEVERCTLAKSKVEVEKAFAALVDEYNTNTHRNRNWEQAYFGEKFAKLTKWGCMSFPDMTLPQRDGASHVCPNAPEPVPLQADAGPQKK
jgi:sarcosine oxidase delta subunit